MATFRPLLKKKKTSIRSGAGAEDVYQPIWFVFEIMERFLGTIYDVESTINTEDRELHSEQAPSPSQQTSSIPSPSEEAPIQSQQDIEMPPPSSSQPSTSSIPSPPQVHTRPNKAKKRVNTNIDEAQIKMSQALDTLNQVLNDKRNKDKANDEIEDECDMYAKLLAKRLRKYPEPMRPRIMYQIDGLLLQNQVDLQPKNTYSRRSSSSLSQYSDDRYQTLSPSPVHVIQTQQPQHPGMPDSSVHISIPETNEIPHHVIQQTSQSQYVIYPSESSVQKQNVSVQPSIAKTNITTQNQSQNNLNIIEAAFWNAAEM